MTPTQPRNVIFIESPADPRLRDYVAVKDRQLHEDFRANPGEGGEAEAPFGKFMAEGETVFAHLVESAFAVLSILCTPSRLEAIRPLLAKIGPTVPIFVLAPALMLQLVGFPLHRGLLAVAARNKPRGVSETLGGNAPVLILENLTNHDNVGATFRNCAALGGQGVLLSEGCADPLYRKSVRVSVGHALRIPFATVAPWPGGLKEIRRAGFTLAALDPGVAAIPLREFAAERAKTGNRRVALLLGTEGPGLSEAARSAADVLVRIPMSDNVDSLNVAVTSALALYEIGGGAKT